MISPSHFNAIGRRRLRDWFCRATLLVGVMLATRGFALDPNKDLDQYDCRSWTFQNGMPVTSVRAIAQTKDGYIWLGTLKGLVRFDGVGFTLVGVPPVSELRSTCVQALCPASSGGLWFGLEKSAYGYHAPDGGWRVGSDPQAGWDWDGLCILETTRKTLWVGGERAAYGSPDTLKLPRLFPGETNLIFVTSLLEDSRGRIWIGTTSRGLYCWQDGKITHIPDASLDSSIIRALAEDKQGRIWIGTYMGLFCYDGNSPPQLAAFPSCEINCLMVDHSGDLWVGTTGYGLFRGKKGVFISSLRKADGLTSDTVLALTEDREESVWVGTSDGLNQLTDVKFQTYGTMSGIPLQTALSVSVSPHGALWVATSQGAFHWETNQAVVYGTNIGLTSPYMKRILEASNGDVFVTSGYNEVKILHEGKVVAHHTFPDMPIAMIEDAKGVIVSVEGDLYRVSRERFEPFEFTGGRKPDLYWILNLSAGRDGTIWVASVNGICRIKDGGFKQWTVADGLADYNTRWVWEENDGTVWIGLATGIARLRNNQIQNIRKQDGLFSGNIWSIVPDDQGNLWVDTPIGICRLNKQNVEDFFDHKTAQVQCVAYDGPEAVKPADKNHQEASACRTPDGRIWFPNAKGVVMVDPAHIARNVIPPPVHIQRTRVNGVELPPTNRIIIPPGRSQLEFSYAALSYIAPQKARFRYRLEGFDSDWVDAGDRRMAYYTNLKPGRYRFQVIAANVDGVWNQTGDSISLELQPDFYQTVWFDILCGVLVLAALGGSYVWRVRHLMHKQRSLQKARDLLEAEVANRTRQLATANASLQREETQLKQRTQSLEKEIEERKRMEEENRRIHRELLEKSRQAGMAEIATNVLHNIGNVLNSVNISASLVVDNVKQSRAASLAKVAALMREHEHDLGTFITRDAKGRQLPVYLGQLAEQLLADQTGAIQELDLLVKNIGHIKDVVTMQQSYARVSGVREIINLCDLVEDSLRMNEAGLNRHQVEVVREYAEVPPINVDKHRVLQILVNLIRNAKHACEDSARADKQMIVRVANGEGRIKISVHDNGVGISPENLARIFNHGFTTRKDGHGFGLHSGALAAKEMGGTLIVHSDGPGKGACFTLELPAQAAPTPQVSLR
jgi:ligand-binding sensor domain-containing protein/signal transduction histidine kinase